MGLLFINAFSGGRESWQHHRFKEPAVWLHLAFFSLYLIGVSYSQNQSAAWSDLQGLLAFVLLPFALAMGSYTISKEQLHQACVTFSLAVTAAAVFSLADGGWHYLQSGSWYEYYPSGLIKEHHLFYTGLAYPLMHPAYFSVYVGSAIFIIWHRRKNLGTWRSILWIGFLLIFLLLLQGRMNILAFALISGIYLIVEMIRRRRLKSLAALGIALALGLSVIPFLPKQVKQRFLVEPSLSYDLSANSMSEYTGFTIRLAEWSCAWPVIEENWLSGVGSGDSRDELMKSYREKGFVMGLKNGFNCHNQYLQTSLAVGMAGFLILLVLPGRYLLLAIKNKRGLLATVTLFFFLSMLTESMLERFKAVMLLNSLLLYLALAVKRKPKAS